MFISADRNALVRRVPHAVAALLAVPEPELRWGTERDHVWVDVLGHHLVIHTSEDVGPGPVAVLAARASQDASEAEGIPVVAVPFMSASGREVCEREGVCWMDFSGNARILAPGLRVIIDGRPNAFPSRGRPASLFAPKSSRLARWLLMHPTETFTQRALAEATGLSKGLVSRLVRRLQEQQYADRDQAGRIRVTQPSLLLDAWRDEYRFSKHTLLRGHVAARTGTALTREVATALCGGALEHAATGLTAAWQLTHFAAFRTATFFVDRRAPALLSERLGFREDPRGANLWLVLPNDEGVFHGATERDGVRCVHAVQAYLDLKEHPERAPEAAERLRAEALHLGTPP